MTPQSSQRTDTHIQSEAINGEQDSLAPSIELGVEQLRRESRTKWDGESSAFDAVLYGNPQSIDSATLQSHKNLNAALAVAVSTDASSSGQGEMNVTAATSATSTQLTRFRAMNRASSRKVHHA